MLENQFISFDSLDGAAIMYKVTNEIDMAPSGCINNYISIGLGFSHIPCKGWQYKKIT